MTTQRAPSPRFTDPDDVHRFRITDDDKQICLFVYRRRVVRSRDIYRAFQHRSEQHLNRRINTLRKNRYLDRLKQTKEEWLHLVGKGTSHMLYALDYKGARLVNDEFNVGVSEQGWRTKNKDLTWQSMPHTLDVTRFMTLYTVAAHKHPSAELVEFDELLKKAPRVTQRCAQPLRFRTTVRWNGEPREAGIMSDAAFGVRCARPDGSISTMYFLHEWDRGTETIVPGPDARRNNERFFHRSSYLKKFLIYHFAFQNRIHQSWFGFTAPFRVLHVTQSQERRESMQRTFRDFFMRPPFRAKAGVNLFADVDTLSQSEGNVFSMPWRDETDRMYYLDGRKAEY